MAPKWSTVKNLQAQGRHFLLHMTQNVTELSNNGNVTRKLFYIAQHSSVQSCYLCLNHLAVLCCKLLQLDGREI